MFLFLFFIFALSTIFDFENELLHAVSLQANNIIMSFWAYKGKLVYIILLSIPY